MYFDELPALFPSRQYILTTELLTMKQGYSEAQLKECLEEYAALNVWQIHPHTFDIRFIDA